LGEKGTVRIAGVAVNKIEKWEFSEYHDMDKNVMSLNYVPANVYGSGHLQYYKKIVANLRDGGENFVDGAEGRKSLEVLMQIYKSSEEGRLVTKSDVQ
jgi:UDP-N-acetyl-2-amino-2-deoxyglucuronate dehydrogenase